MPASASPPPSGAAAPIPSTAAVSQGDIGDEGPVGVLAASASGAWVALCQGQPPSPRLVLGSGSGEAIDDLLDRDPTGRYVVTLRDGKAVLIDSIAASRVDLTELGADVRRAKQDYARHRALSFDERGQLLAYVRHRGAERSIVLRDLPSGTERVLVPNAGEVFQLRLSAGARFVTFDAVREDTSGNGKLDWPVPEQPANTNPCAASAVPKLRSYSFLGRGDRTTRGVVSVDAGSARDVPELVTPLGSQLLVREPDGSLRLDTAGKRRPLAPPACAGRVLFADAERELALVTCIMPKKTGKRSVWLFGADAARDLHSELYETTTDREAVSGVRLVPLYPGSESSLVDLERRAVLPLPSGSRVLHTTGDRALIWRGNELFSYDAETQREERIAEGVHKNPDLLQAGDATLLSPFVVLGAAGPAREMPAAFPLAISTTGHVLTSSSAETATSSTARVPIQGPLHWLDAKLPPSDGPPR